MNSIPRRNKDRATLAVQAFRLVLMIGFINIIFQVGLFLATYLDHIVTFLNTDETYSVSGSYAVPTEVSNAINYINVGYILLFIVGMCLLISWLRRAYKNLERVGITTQFQDFWVIVGWLFAPFSLFRPYQIITELREKLLQDISISSEMIQQSLINTWWTLFLIGCFLPVFSYFIDIENVFLINLILIVSGFTGLVFQYLTVKIIKKINELEELFYKKYMNTNEDMSIIEHLVD